MRQNFETLSHIMALDFSGEYTIRFNTKPFGIKFGKTKSDSNNLYVTGITKGSPAAINGVILKSKVIKFEDETVERQVGCNRLAKDIQLLFVQKYNDTVPFRITFRKPPPKSPSVNSVKSSAIAFPVDCGENALSHSSPTQLQKSFLSILHYMATDGHSEKEWCQFLSLNDKVIPIQFTKSTVSKSVSNVFVFSVCLIGDELPSMLFVWK